MNRIYDTSLILRLFGASTAFVLTLVLSRLLGPAGYGAYAFAMSWVNIALLVTTLGFHHFCVRAFPPMLHDRRYGAARGLVLTALALTGTVAIALTLGVPALADVLLLSPDPRLEGALVAGALLLLPLTLNQLRAGLLRGLSRPILAQIPEQMLQPLLLLLMIGAVAWAYGVPTGGGLDAADALRLAAIAAYVSLVFGAVPAVRALCALPGDRLVLKPVQWLVEAGKSTFLFAAGVVMASTDVVMLGALSTAEQTGLYGVAARFFLLMHLPALAASATLSHEAARLKAAGQFLELSFLVRRTATRTALTAIGLAALCTLPALGPGLLFGPGFAAATVPMLILIWSRVGEAVFGHPASVLANAGGVGRAGTMVALGALVNALLNFVLIPRMGAVGAALATAVTHLVLTAAMAWTVWCRFGVVCLPRGGAMSGTKLA